MLRHWKMSHDESEVLEKRVLRQMRTPPGLTHPQTTPGIGPVRDLTILLDAGDLSRFAYVRLRLLLSLRRQSNQMSHGKPGRESATTRCMRAMILT